ncbi:hypothetical protein DFJ58DRAFT_734425 [Suillus subalutaceus]|uniref:uncharacterized protein n=1 Tax=Suillus subalutaceus TaxID=48586 RepID=UPI001B86DC89|nr:uncharacterized protein DFJ58DRAFT_734425 [Suillus subalutaceus]KAG1837380.1 hypothetical protein DFJ58DRAFT_734425 [Suillus subalutaceus]
MISHQELSAQQVAAYLMEFGNHYTSHEFINVFWTLFENHVDAILPLPKSYVAEEHYYDQADSLKPPSDEEVMQNLADNDLANDEVGLSMDDSGNLVPRANQVQDYTLRSSGLRDMCIWDFVAQVQKQKTRQLKKDDEAHFPDNEDVIAEDCPDDLELDSNIDADDTSSTADVRTRKARTYDPQRSIEDIMKVKTRLRPSFQLLDKHMRM